LAWALAREPAEQVLGIGIAGAFDGSGLAVGDACWIGLESFADLGSQDGEEWLDYPALSLPGLPKENRLPLALPSGATGRIGTTCSTVTGNEETARLRRSRLGAEVEGMEGAAWALVCGRFDVPLMQARGISNRVGRRDRAAWKIGEALDSLGRLLESTPGI
jgi:futalosine hydrolase